MPKPSWPEGREPWTGATLKGSRGISPSVKSCLDDTVVDFRAGRRAPLMAHPDVLGDIRCHGGSLPYSSQRSCPADLGTIIFTERETRH